MNWKTTTITEAGEDIAVEWRKALKADEPVFEKSVTSAIGTNLDPATYPRQIDMRDHEGDTYAEPVSDEGAATGYRFVVKGQLPATIALKIFLTSQGPKEGA